MNSRRLQVGEMEQFQPRLRSTAWLHCLLFQGKRLGCVCSLPNITLLSLPARLRAQGSRGHPGLSETARKGCDYPSFYLYEMTETETKDHPCAQALLQLCRNIARLCDCCGMAGRLKDCREGRREGRVRCRGMHSRSHNTFWACGEASINIRRARLLKPTHVVVH